MTFRTFTVKPVVYIFYTAVNQNFSQIFLSVLGEPTRRQSINQFCVGILIKNCFLFIFNYLHSIRQLAY